MAIYSVKATQQYEQRYRSGMRFTPEPVIVDLDHKQYSAIKDDPTLIIMPPTKEEHTAQAEKIAKGYVETIIPDAELIQAPTNNPVM